MYCSCRRAPGTMAMTRSYTLDSPAARTPLTSPRGGVCPRLACRPVLLGSLLAGLAAGLPQAAVAQAPPAAPAAPAPGHKPVIDLEGRIYVPGMAIPRYAEAVSDIRGQRVNLLGPGKQLVVFTAPRCQPCSEMIMAVEATLAQHRLGAALQRVYIVDGDPAAAAQVAAGGAQAAPVQPAGAGSQAAPVQSGAAGAGDAPGSPAQIVADPDGRIAAHLKAPFRPYGLLLENGALKYPVIWQKDAQKIASLVRFFILGAEGMKAAGDTQRPSRGAEGGAGNASATAPATAGDPRRSPPPSETRGP